MKFDQKSFRLLNQSLEPVGIKVFIDSELSDRTLVEMIDLDKKTYPNEYQFSLERCRELLAINPYIYTYAVDTHTNKLIGYINTMNLTESEYIKMRNGTMPDSLIDVSQTLPFALNGINRLYFASIVVNPDYRNKGVADAMLYALSIKLEPLLMNGKSFYVLSDGLSKQGENLSKKHSLHLSDASSNGSTIFEKEFITKNEKQLLLKTLRGIH
ncbi:MAG: GNAT family N-acetyltransferase [Methanomicrobia archaeon]|nr:GNAT family N-acetyltransferase [Methanomicrobia archaeon]